MAGPANTPNQPVYVEYTDSKGHRVKSKPFTNHCAARRFYADKAKQRRDPKVIKHEVSGTGRVPTTNPPVQNLPVNTKEGARIRKAFKQ